MPSNKNAQYRYRVLNDCFRDKMHRYTFQDLLDKVNECLYELGGIGSEIKTRQLRDDIAAIRNMLPKHEVSLETPILEGKKCYYQYDPVDYSLFDDDLTIEDVQKLTSTIDLLKKYSGLPSTTWLEEVITSLELRFGIKANPENLVSFGQNEQLKGLEFLSILIDATINHSTLELRYRSSKGTESTETVYPYHMRQYNNRWFLIGRKKGKTEVDNFALDRIQHFKVINVPFIPNDIADFSKYFNDIIGVSVPRKDAAKDVEKIVLRFNPRRIQYVLTKPLHPSQMRINDTDISIKVIPTRELYQQIFSFGPDVEVIEPQSFRSEFAKKIEESYKKYFTVQNDCTVHS